jgi:hypothetical protein
MVEDKCGAKAWTLKDGKWKEHSCAKRRPANPHTHNEQNWVKGSLITQYLHMCDCGYKWNDDKPVQPWEKNLPSREEVQRQMAELIGV